MGKDYYEILGLVKGVTEIEIRQAYKTLAFKFHPECSIMPGAAEKFQEAAEAYDVLSDPRKRDIFDKYGEEGLKGKNPENEIHNYHGDALLTFVGFMELDHNKHYTQDPVIEHIVLLSLDEIRLGCTKDMTICRKIIQPNGIIREEDICLSFDVFPGCKTGTKFVFKGAGDRGQNLMPTDVIFVIEDLYNSCHKRKGSNVYYTVKLTLKEALCGVVVNVPLLCGGNMSFILENEIVSPLTMKRIRGQGLPIPNMPNRRGDLYIQFDIKFPGHLSRHAKLALSNMPI